MRNASHSVPMQALDDRFSQLARTFELASGETMVMPRCQIRPDLNILGVSIQVLPQMQVAHALTCLMQSHCQSQDTCSY